MSKDIYDISPGRQKVLHDNAARRLELRNYFLKESSNPFKHATKDQGYVFDPAIQRFTALRVTNYERFKPNLKTFKYPFFLFILPFSITTYLMYKDRKQKEDRFRRGEVAYKDRLMKFL